MKTKVQNLTKMFILAHRTVNHRKICNALLHAPMCPLQIINDIEPLSSTLYGANAHFIHHPSNLENYSIGNKSETSQPKKGFITRKYFYTFLEIFGSKFKIPTATEIRSIF